MIPVVNHTRSLGNRLLQTALHRGGPKESDRAGGRSPEDMLHA